MLRFFNKITPTDAEQQRLRISREADVEAAKMRGTAEKERVILMKCGPGRPKKLQPVPPPSPPPDQQPSKRAKSTSSVDSPRSAQCSSSSSGSDPRRHTPLCHGPRSTVGSTACATTVSCRSTKHNWTVHQFSVRTLSTRLEVEGEITSFITTLRTAGAPVSVGVARSCMELEDKCPKFSIQ